MLKIDLHLHTNASGHAFNTILEYVEQAKKLKMKVIGISDHGKTSYGSLTNDYYFGQFYRMPKVINGVRVLYGIEANIKSDGSLDVTENNIKKLDYVMAGLHDDSYDKDLGRAGNTKAILQVISSGKVNILTHPFIYAGFEVEHQQIFEAACKHNVLMEINLSYLKEPRLTEQTLENLKLMLSVVKKHQQKIIVNSDSHNIWELGDDLPLKKLQPKLRLEKELIINNYPKELFKLLKFDEK